MKRFLLFFLIFSFLQHTAFNCYADWLLGEGITWKCIGADSFLIKLTLYRDCNGIPAPSTFPIKFQCNTTGNTITTTSISQIGVVDITPVCISSCSRCSNPSCSFPYGMQKVEYQKLVVLSIAGSCCMIRISNSTSCRMNGITTGAADMNLYIESIMNRCLSPCDNSPQFTNDPLLIICAGQDVNFNNGVFDPDTNIYGIPIDSLLFEWAPPLENYGASIPYNTPYSYNKPLKFLGFPNENIGPPQGYHLDIHTGNIIFRPLMVEMTTVVIKVKEFRKGVYIGEVTRDITLSIISCPANYNPQIITPNNQQHFEVCAGSPVNLTFQTNDMDTSNHVTIKWNNAIKNASWTNNNGQVKHPTATFSWTPDSNHVSDQPYMFTVLAEDDHCPMKGSASINIQIKVKSSLYAGYSVQDSGCGKYYFNATALKGNPAFSWTGSGGLNSTSRHFTFRYASPGTYPFTLAVTKLNYCPSIFKDTIITGNFLYTILPSDTTLCDGSYLTINSIVYLVKGKVSYHWSNGDTIHSSITIGPLHSDTLISLNVIDSTKCTFSNEMMIHVRKLTVINAGNDTTMCEKSFLTRTVKYILDKNANSHILKWYNTTDTSTISHDEKIILKNTGHYICLIKDDINCFSTDTFSLLIHPFPIVFAGNDDSICVNNTGYRLNGIPAGIDGYWTGTATYKDTFDDKWYFNSSAKEIKHLETYPLIYHYYDSNRCYKEDTMQIRVSKFSVSAGQYNPQCINTSSVNLTGFPNGGTWSGKGIINNNQFSPLLAGLGQHKILYTFTRFCVQTDSTAIEVVDLPKINISTQDGRTVFCKEEGLVHLVGSPSNGPHASWWSGYGLKNSNYFDPSTGNGVYNPIYHNIDTNGCYNDSTLVLYVTDPLVAFNNSEKAICEGKSIDLYVISNYNHGILWFKDTASDGNLSYKLYDDKANYSPGTNDNQKGYFKVYVKTNDTACTPAYAYLTMVIGKNPVADFNAAPVTGKPPLQVNFSDRSVLTGSLISSYWWDFGDTSCSTLQNPVHDYQYPGTYPVKLRVISEYGCEDSVIKNGYIKVIATSVTEMITSEITILPNPANDFITIKLRNSNQAIESVVILNSVGQTVKTFNDLNAKEFRINRDEIEKGIYFLKIGFLNNQIVYYKVIFE